MPFETLRLSIRNELTVLTFPVQEAAVLAVISMVFSRLCRRDFYFFFPHAGKSLAGYRFFPDLSC